ncbi:Uncharacterized protein FWK35_00001405, partial [Aphis craccivora]
MLDRTSTVLIPGAMSNSLDRYRTIKIDGKPLFLTKDRRVKTIGGKIFNDKEELLFPVLRQMQDSINAKNKNLSIKCIKKYLERNKREPIIVFWNGSTNKEIMERLGLGKYQMLEIIFVIKEKLISSYNNNVPIMSTIFKITVVLIVACCSIYGIERYADQRIITHSGLSNKNYDNQLELSGFL